MVLKIRLSRFGRRHAPHYNIVVAQARSARDSEPLEVLGSYDPIPRRTLDCKNQAYKTIQLDFSRTKYWLGVGAQPSKPMWQLLSMVGFMPPKLSPTPDYNPSPSHTTLSHQLTTSTSSPIPNNSPSNVQP